MGFSLCLEPLENMFILTCHQLQIHLRENGVRNPSSSGINEDRFPMALCLTVELQYSGVAGVNARIWGVSMMGWSTRHQACWCWMGFIFLKAGRGSLLMS